MVDLFKNIEVKEYEIAEKKDILTITLKSSFIDYTIMPSIVVETQLT